MPITVMLCQLLALSLGICWSLYLRLGIDDVGMPMAPLSFRRPRHHWSSSLPLHSNMVLFLAGGRVDYVLLRHLLAIRVLKLVGISRKCTVEGVRISRSASCTRRCRRKQNEQMGAREARLKLNQWN